MTRHGPHVQLRMPRWIRIWLYAVSALSALSGSIWLLLHHFVRVEGPFGPQRHPLEPSLLATHGATAVLMAWVFGLIWLAHVRRGWTQRVHRFSGILLLAMLLLLALSGWMLYYVGDEDWRALVSPLHWIVGITASLWLPWHIVRGRWRIRMMRQSPPAG